MNSRLIWFSSICRPMKISINMRWFRSGSILDGPILKLQSSLCSFFWAMRCCVLECGFYSLYGAILYYVYYCCHFGSLTLYRSYKYYRTLQQTAVHVYSIRTYYNRQAPCMRVLCIYRVRCQYIDPCGGREVQFEKCTYVTARWTGAKRIGGTERQ